MIRQLPVNFRVERELKCLYYGMAWVTIRAGAPLEVGYSVHQHELYQSCQ